MPLPSSGPMTLTMIAQQYGGSPPHSLSEYYKGGAYVTNTAGNANVPTSGVIRLSNFYGQGNTGGGGMPLAASNTGANGDRFQAEPAPATLSVTGSGSVFASGGTGSYTCTWSHISGDTGIPTPAANVFTPSFSAMVPKNTLMQAVKRCTVNDGVNSVSTDMTVRLEYRTNL